MVRLFVYPSGVARSILERVGCFFRVPNVPKSISHVRRAGQSYLSAKALTELHGAIRRIEAERIRGIIVEAGVGGGGSAFVIASAKRPERPLYLFDVFDMIPRPGARDGLDARLRYRIIRSGYARGIGDAPYYGYRENLLEKIREQFHLQDLDPDQHNISFFKGAFDTTLHIDQPVALAHIDCDWYDSTMICLQRIEPNLSPGGRIIIDDYFHWKGCRRAVDEYFKGRDSEFRFELCSALHISKG